MDGKPFETLRHWSRRRGGAPVLLGTLGRPPLTWAKLPTFLSEFAGILSDSGVGRTSRIALILPPGPEAITVFLAAIRAGIAVPLNPELTPVELNVSLQRLQPHLLIFRAGLPGRVESVAATLGIPALQLDWSSADVAGIPKIVATTTAFPVSSNDPLAVPAGTRLILQTSGTTARPKLVPLTDKNLEASAAALISSLALTDHDRGLNLLPQFHIGGLWDLVAGPLLSGGSVICGGMFSTAAFEAGCRLNPTWVQLAPPMLRAVVQDPVVRPHTLRLIRSVSAALPSSLKNEAEKKFGVPIVEIYGMTETAGVITSNPLESARQHPGSVGPSVGPTIKIRDVAGSELPVGMSGEVVICGAQLSPGYIDAGPTDAMAFGAHGFRTGDLGRLDSEGNLYLLGRSKDLINRGGEMVSPAEIEEVLLAMPDILDAAVFGIPHPTLGEEIGAAVVLKGGVASCEFAGRLQALLRPILGHARLPSRIYPIDTIPRTLGGKLQRAVLLKRFVLGLKSQPAEEGGRLPQGLSQDWPESPLPRWVAEIWAQALGIPVMGADDDFFAAGGCSLRAAQSVAILQDRFPEEIVYVSSVYEAPTPRLQAAFLEKNHPAVAARVMGQAVQLGAVPVEPVNLSLRERFQAALTDPLPQFTPPTRRNPRAIFILGAPRSGSTLLRAMLAGHPDLFAPPELYLLSHPDLPSRRAWYSPAHTSQLEGLPRAWMGASGISAEEALAKVADLEARGTGMPDAYRLLQVSIGKRILVDKTPFYGAHPHVLAAAETIFENVFFIHLSRHPYGMIRSFEEARLAQLWWPRLTGPGKEPCPFHPRQLGEMIWARIHANVLHFLGGRTPATWMHVRYEQLTDDPEATCRNLAEAVGLPFHPGMLEPLGDPASRMTDGLLPGSRMIGDPKFHRHRSIEKAAADRWKQHYHQDFLSEETWALASRLGHGTRLAEASRNEVFDL